MSYKLISSLSHPVPIYWTEYSISSKVAPMTVMLKVMLKAQSPQLIWPCDSTPPPYYTPLHYFIPFPTPCPRPSKASLESLDLAGILHIYSCLSFILSYSYNIFSAKELIRGQKALPSSLSALLYQVALGLSLHMSGNRLLWEYGGLPLSDLLSWRHHYIFVVMQNATKILITSEVGKQDAGRRGEIHDCMPGRMC